MEYVLTTLAIAGIGGIFYLITNIHPPHYSA